MKNVGLTKTLQKVQKQEMVLIIKILTAFLSAQVSDQAITVLINLIFGTVKNAIL